MKIRHILSMADAVHVCLGLSTCCGRTLANTRAERSSEEDKGTEINAFVVKKLVEVNPK